MANNSLRYRSDRKYDVSKKTPLIPKISKSLSKGARFESASISSLKPGSVISCFYDGRLRLALVVKTKKTTSGLYTSSRGNKLLTLFLLNSITDDKIGTVINTVYKEKNISDYKQLPKLKSLKELNVRFTERFRTFNISKIEKLRALKISTKEVFKR